VPIKMDTSKISEDNTGLYSEWRQMELPSRKILKLRDSGRLTEVDREGERKVTVIRIKGNSA